MNRAAVLGSPISHSLSPVIHQCAYEILEWNWNYERFDVKSGELAKFLASHTGEFRGLSLTMPLKEEAIGLLDTVSDLGKRVSAVNTIVFDEIGAHGFNTDVQGFVDAMSFHHVSIPDRVAILGGGATARSAIAAVDGFAKRIEVFARSAHRTRSLVNSAEHAIVNVHSWEEVSDALAFDLVISTTPAGATDLLPVRSTPATLFESLYNPWPTPLLQKWRNAGGRGIDGLDLLVWQAIGQLQYMGFDQNQVLERKAELYQKMRAAALLTL